MFLVEMFIYLYKHKIQISLISSKQKNYTNKEKKFHLVVQTKNTNFTFQRPHTVKTLKLKVKGLQPTPLVFLVGC